MKIAEVCERLQLSEEELREDVNVLNVVNFGGGSYVLYAEIKEEEGEIEVDPEPYSDNFDRPARLLPVEAKALVAAIDLIGEHLPEGSLDLRPREDRRGARRGPDGTGPAGRARRGRRLRRWRASISTAIVERRIIELEYYKENEDQIVQRRVEPYALRTAARAGTSPRSTPSAAAMRHFRLDRIKSVDVTQERSSPGPRSTRPRRSTAGCAPARCEASRAARVLVSPERARWAREARRVVEERRDGAVVVELSFAGVDWLVREILKEAGDAAVLEPEDAREAVRAAVVRLREAHAVPAGV